MTIQLTRATYVNGSLEAIGSQHTLDTATEAYFISMGMATRVGSAPNVSGSVNQAFISTDSNVNTVLVGGGGTYATIKSSNTFVSVSNPTEIIEAIADLNDTFQIRLSQTAVITATNGSATVTGVGTGWASTNKIGVGDLWKPDSGSRYYKVKFINSDTQITLWEPYQGTTISATSTAFKFYYLKRYSLLLSPGEYSVVGASPIVLQPGFDFVALDPHATAFNEGQSSPASPFSNLSDNNFTNIRFAPTANFGAMDGMFGGPSIKADAWAGITSKFTNCIVHAGNARSIHSGGTTRIPVIAGGTMVYDSCEFLQDHVGSFGVGGGLTASNSNTKVIMESCIHRKVTGSDSKKTTLAYPSALMIVDFLGALRGTFYINNALIDYPDYGLNPIIGNAAGIGIYVPAIVNINCSRADVANTSGGSAIACGIDVQEAATVNISGTSLDASGTTGTGINIGAYAATVNVRAGSRVKGSANSINAGAGSTVNVSGNADLIGATTGAGTINLATAT